MDQVAAEVTPSRPRANTNVFVWLETDLCFIVNLKEAASNATECQTASMRRLCAILGMIEAPRLITASMRTSGAIA
jgi:hypothetical protein